MSGQDGAASPVYRWTMALALGTLPALDRLAAWRGDVVFVALLVLVRILDLPGQRIDGQDLSPWSPQIGVLLWWLLIGPRRAPLIGVVAFVAADAIAPGAAWEDALLPATLSFLGVWLAAFLLRHMRFDPTLILPRDLVMLLAIASSSLALATLATSALGHGADQPGWASIEAGFSSLWIGKVAGMVTVTPLLLRAQYGLLGEGRPEILRDAARALEISVQLALLVGIVLASHNAFGATHERMLYLAFLPIAWIAVRSGLNGSTVSVFALMLTFEIGGLFEPQSEDVLILNQVATLGMGVAGLLLGSVASERDRVERDLRTSEGWLRAILDASKDGVVILDRDRRIVEINPAACGMFGYVRAAAFGRQIVALLPELSVDGTQTQVVQMGLKRDGTTIPIEVAVGTASGAATGVTVLTLREVSERLESERRRRSQVAEMELINRRLTVGEMAAAMAHEVSQPLSAIASYVDVCQRQIKELPTEARETVATTLGKVAAQARRAGEVMRTVRGYLRAGESARRRVDLDTLIAEALDLADIEARNRRIALMFEPDLPLPAVRVFKVQIEQVILNLVRNAMDAMDQTKHTTPTIRIGAKRINQDTVAVTVADMGTGIAETAVGRLFDPFYTSKPQGMGLGLSISRTIVEAHGGSLTLAENSSHGAVFQFTLPIDFGDEA